MRGHRGPACNAVGYVDRQVWGVNHFYIHPVWGHLKVTSNDMYFLHNNRSDLTQLVGV